MSPTDLTLVPKLNLRVSQENPYAQAAQLILRADLAHEANLRAMFGQYGYTPLPLPLTTHSLGAAEAMLKLLLGSIPNLPKELLGRDIWVSAINGALIHDLGKANNEIYPAHHLNSGPMTPEEKMWHALGGVSKWDRILGFVRPYPLRPRHTDIIALGMMLGHHFFGENPYPDEKDINTRGLVYFRPLDIRNIFLAMESLASEKDANVPPIYRITARLAQMLNVADIVAALKEPRPYSINRNGSDFNPKQIVMEQLARSNFPDWLRRIGLNVFNDIEIHPVVIDSERELGGQEMRIIYPYKFGNTQSAAD